MYWDISDFNDSDEMLEKASQDAKIKTTELNRKRLDFLFFVRCGF